MLIPFIPTANELRSGSLFSLPTRLRLYLRSGKLQGSTYSQAVGKEVSLRLYALSFNQRWLKLNDNAYLS